MPSTEIVTSFQGLRYGRDPASAFSQRRALDTPRELVNLLHDEHGQLWLPPAASEVFHAYGSGTIRHVANVAGTNIGNALIVQRGTSVDIFDTDLATPVPNTAVASLGSSDIIWVNATDDAVYIGTPANTWKITKSGGSYTTSALSGQPHGFHSYSYQGRRFVLQRNQTLVWSDINQPETFGGDSTQEVGGDQTGGSWAVRPGSVVALMEIENVLLIFCTQSVWAFTGDSPSNFQLRRTNATAGCWARDTLIRVDDGILFLGGTPRGEMGVHLFSGNNSIPVGDDVGGFFREWTFDGGSFDEANQNFSAVRWRDRYILSARGVDGDRQVYVYDLTTEAWSTFSAWSDGPALGLIRYGGSLDLLMVTNGGTLYETEHPCPRAPSAPAGNVVLGWHDRGRPSGMARFMAAKVGGWAAPSEGSLTATVSVPGDDEDYVETLPTDFHDHTVLPINLRGKSVELDIDISGTEALLESVELILSRKGEKLSRG